MASAAKRFEVVSGTAAPQIAFHGATLVLGGKTIIENLSLGVRPGEFLCIVGASGCGKTTALRLAAGLDGLGHWVLLSARAFRSADLFAGVILLGITGYVTSVAMSFAEHRLLAWQAAQR